LKRSTWTLLVGLTVAGIVLAAGTANAWRLQRNEQALLAACKAHKAITVPPSQYSANEPPPDAVLRKLSDDDLIAIKKAGVPDLTKVSDDEIGSLTAKHDINVFGLLEAREHLKDAVAGLDVLWDNESCDPQVLATAPDVRWMYADLLTADRAAAEARSIPFRFVALLIAVVSVLPAAWYFLLRRIAELRAAIGGDPPAG
jgi:hypothetical protein